ncbi:MAG: hypothetical protein HRT98_02275 [Mycoplasmatales bacterium]|nr:hypothetical protein [Mycoplasmatales bacterium]
MTILESLKTKFGDKITYVKWEEEFGATFLRVEVQEPKLNELTILSKEISDYLDTIDQTDKEYFLDIFSGGTDKEVSFDELSEMIEENILVTLVRPIKDKIQFEGTLIEVDSEGLTIKWNAKGQFRKQKLAKEDIEKMNLSAKVKKEGK